MTTGPRFPRKTPRPTVPAALLREVFNFHVAAVERGDRCPTIRDIIEHLRPLDIPLEGCGPSDVTIELARRGDLEFLDYPQGFRVVIIRVGRLSGRQSVGPPFPRWRPHSRVWINGWERIPRMGSR